jgi:hypothetical protein
MGRNLSSWEHEGVRGPRDSPYASPSGWGYPIPSQEGLAHKKCEDNFILLLCHGALSQKN